MADEPAPQLTPAQRKRNVERVREVEQRLGEMEQALGHHVQAGTLLMRQLREQRQQIRRVLGLDPLGPMAPFFEATAGDDPNEEEDADDGNAGEG
jgi:hypothetical protein